MNLGVLHKAPVPATSFFPNDIGVILSCGSITKVGCNNPAGYRTHLEVDGETCHSLTMRLPTAILASLLAACGGISPAQEAPAPLLQSELDEQRSLLERVIANQKKNDLAQFTYERLESLGIYKGNGATPPAAVKTTPSAPAGAGTHRIS